jgi:hypothetical protein
MTEAQLLQSFYEDIKPTCPYPENTNGYVFYYDSPQDHRDLIITRVREYNGGDYLYERNELSFRLMFGHRNYSFIWEDSPEGRVYWKRVYESFFNEVYGTGV